jgi:glycosyltransferase involved in cell wall biosynthesis
MMVDDCLEIEAPGDCTGEGYRQPERSRPAINIRELVLTPDERVLDVSVILPVHNERGHIRKEIDRIRSALEASPHSFEIIVVDDGSTDGSGEELREMDGIRLLQFTRNRGVGSARKAGTLAAGGRIVVWTDVDLTYPNDEIPRLVKELEGYDQVVGARTSEEGTAKSLRVPAKWFIRKLASYLVEFPIPDLNSGFRAFRRDVAQQFLYMLPSGFSCVSTMTMTFLANGYAVKHIPIDYSARAGSSKFHWWADTKRYLTQVVRMVLTFNPLRFFMPLSITLTAIGLAKLGYDWTTKSFHLAANTLLIFFAALQLFSIGLLADLVVRLNRPRDQIDPASL